MNDDARQAYEAHGKRKKKKSLFTILLNSLSLFLFSSLYSFVFLRLSRIAY